MSTEPTAPLPPSQTAPDMLAPRLPASGLVTLIGGSGFLGRHLTEAFARAGWRVMIACRNPAHAHRLKPLGMLGQIGALRADIRIPDSLAPALAGADLAINLVGILAEGGGRRFDAIHARGAGDAARAAAAAGVRAFIQVSAIGADPQSPSAYGRSKAEGEAAVRAAFPSAAIVRPSLVFGPDDGFTNRFAGLAASAPVIPVVRPHTRFQPVHVGDVAQGILAIAALVAAGRAAPLHEFGGPEILTMREIMRFIADAVGRPDARLLELPDAASSAIAAFGFLPGAPLTRDQYRMLGRDNVVAPGTPGLPQLGIAPVALAAVASGWLARYRRGGRFAGMSSGA